MAFKIKEDHLVLFNFVITYKFLLTLYIKYDIILYYRMPMVFYQADGATDYRK